MSPDLEALIQLQRLETTIADAKGRIAAQPQRLADADASLDEATKAVEGVKARLKTNQDARRTLEKDAALQQTRLSKYKEQLFEVKTNREYQAMQHEIETAQQELGAAEEKVLERMMEADVIAADLKSTEAALAARKKDVERERTALTQELATVEASLREAIEARAALMKKLDARLIALFEQVSRVRKGVAICTATRDGLCSLCHVRLRPSVFQQVRHNDSIIQCDSCQRILYWIPPPPPVEAPVVHTS